MRLLLTVTLLVTFALEIWARIEPTPTRGHYGRHDRKSPVIVLHEQGIPIMRRSRIPNRQPGRETKPVFSGFPADFNDLPVKTEVHVEGEDITIWAMKLDHIDAVVPILKDFLCGNPEYSPFFPTLCHRQYTPKAKPCTLTHSTSPTAGPEDCPSRRHDQDSGKGGKSKMQDRTRLTSLKAGTLRPSPSRHLSTVYIPRGKKYITSIVEIGDEHGPLDPAKPNFGCKDQDKTAGRSGGFSRLTRARTPKTTDRRSSNKNGGLKSPIKATKSGKSEQLGGFHLTRTRQPRPSSHLHTKEPTPSPTRYSAMTSLNKSSAADKSSGHTTRRRASFYRSYYRSKFSNSDSEGFEQPTISKHPTNRADIDNETASHPVAAPTNVSSMEKPPPSLRKVSSRSLVSRHTCSIRSHSVTAIPTRTRSTHRTVPYPINVISKTGSQTISSASNTTISGAEVASSKSTQSEYSPARDRTAKKAAAYSNKSSASSSMSTLNQSWPRPRTGTRPTSSQATPSSQVRKTPKFPSTAISTARKSQTPSESLRESWKPSLVGMQSVSTLPPKTSITIIITDLGHPGGEQVSDDGRGDGRPSHDPNGNPATTTKPEWPKELTATVTVWPYSSTSLKSLDQPLATTFVNGRKREVEHEAVIET